MEDQQKQAQSEQPTPITQESSASPGPNHEEPPKKSWTGKLSPKKLMMIVITILILTGGGVAAFFILKPAPTKKAQLTQKDNSASVDPNCSKDGTTLKANWTAARQKIKVPDFFKTATEMNSIILKKPIDIKEVEVERTYNEYYKVGTTNKGQAIILFAVPVEGISYHSGIAIEDTPGHFTVLGRHLSTPTYFQVNSNASVDATSYFSELCVSQLAYKGQTLELGYADMTQGYRTATTSSLKNVQNYPNGTLYIHTGKEDATYKVEAFIFQRNDTRWIHLGSLDPFTLIKKESVDGNTIYVTDITWLDNSKNSGEYRTTLRGCGPLGTLEIARGVSLSDLTKIGTEVKGKPIYELTSIDHPLFNLHFKEYQDVDANGQFNDPKDKALHGLSKEAFKKLRPMFIFKDQFERFVVYTKSVFISDEHGCH